MRARSRLPSTQPGQQPHTPKYTRDGWSIPLSLPRSSTTYTRHLSSYSSWLASTYLPKLPLLVVALICWLIVWFIVSTYSPSSIANAPVYGLYLWFLLPLGGALTYTTWFIFIKLHRAISITLILMWLVFLKLHGIPVTTALMVWCVIFLLVSEGTYRIMVMFSASKTHKKRVKYA